MYRVGGGGLYDTDSRLYVQECSFTSCSATGPGGGIHTYHSQSVSLQNCVFDRCSGTDCGGAAFLDMYTAGGVTIEGVVLTGCSSLLSVHQGVVVLSIAITPVRMKSFSALSPHVQQIRHQVE